MFKRHRSAALEAGNSIVDGVIWQKLLIFFFPILLGTFFQQLYNTADAIIVGKYVGQEAMAAAGGARYALCRDVPVSRQDDIRPYLVRYNYAVVLPE